MTNTTDKAKLVGSILKITNKVGQSKYFDRLTDKDEQYLGRLLTVCKNLKKVK